MADRPSRIHRFAQAVGVTSAAPATSTPTAPATGGAPGPAKRKSIRSRPGESNTAGKLPGDRSKAQGRSGTVNTRGFLQDREFNRDLLWPNNLDEYDRMRKTDPTVRWMIALLSTPLRAATATIEPPEDPDETEMEATCFARHAVFEELEGGFAEHLRQALDYPVWGHSVFERIAELAHVNFTVDPLEEGGDPKQVERDAFILAQLGPRLPRTIQRWHPDTSDSSKLDHITQYLSDGLGASTIDIKADRLVIYTNEKEGDDWRGVSILRSAWSAYMNKREIENIEAVAFERTAGVPVVYPPNEASDEQLDAIEEGLKKMRQGDQVYMIMPGPKQQPSRTAGGQGEQWLIEDIAVEASAGLATEFSNAISRYDTAMARNVMASFMQLGMQQVGARATADVQQDPYYQALEAYANYIEDTFSEAVIRPLIDWNYSVDRYPRLTFSKIQAKNVEVVAKAVAELANAGLLQKDQPLEDYLRELVDAPDRDPDYEEPELAPLIALGPDGKPKATRTGDEPGGGGGKVSEPGQAEPGAGATSAVTAHAERFAQDPGAFIAPRALIGGEQYVAWAQVKAVLDNAPLDIAAVAERAMEGQIKNAEELAAEAVTAHNTGAIEKISLDATPMIAAIQSELERVFATGQSDIRAEVRRGKEAGQRPPTPSEAMAQEAEGEGKEKQPWLSKVAIAAIIATLARTLGEEAAAAATRAVRSQAVKAMTSGEVNPATPGEDPLAEMRAALKRSSPLASNRIYSLGRMDEIRSLHYAGWVTVLMRSAVLDINTCEVCSAADGETSPPEYATPLPDPFCEGGDRCRCVYVPEIEPAR